MSWASAVLQLGDSRCGSITKRAVPARRRMYVPSKPSITSNKSSTSSISWTSGAHALSVLLAGTSSPTEGTMNLAKEGLEKSHVGAGRDAAGCKFQTDRC